MSKFEWFIRDTLFFIGGSRSYMKGEKVTPLMAVKAYWRFMRACAKDRKQS